MNIRRAGGRPLNGLPPAAVLTAAGAPAIKAGARVGGGKRVGERSAAIAARSVMGGEVSLGRRRWDIWEREEHGESRGASEASAVQKQLFRA